MVDIPTTAACLSQVFRGSLKCGRLPTQRKLAHVTPIHKGGLETNYRPNFVISIPCKILEHIAIHHLNKRLDGILHNRQRGFGRGMFCETQLCATYHDLVKPMDSAETTHPLILDFKKSFETVPPLLLRNIANLDITPMN